METRYHWSERWRFDHGASTERFVRRTDGARAATYTDAAKLEARDRGITLSQLLTDNRSKWITLQEVTPQPEPQPELAEVIPFPGGRNTETYIKNAHYDRTNVLMFLVSGGAALMLTGLGLALLASAAPVVFMALLGLGGWMIARGVSNKKARRATE